MGTRSTNDPIFQPVTINGLTFKNRIIRSSLGGRIDYYDGSMSDARIAWDRQFARGGVSAIISSNAGIRTDGIAVPGYAAIDHDRTIPSWRALVRKSPTAATSDSATVASMPGMVISRSTSSRSNAARPRPASMIRSS